MKENTSKSTNSENKEEKMPSAKLAACQDCGVVILLENDFEKSYVMLQNEHSLLIESSLNVDNTDLIKNADTSTKIQNFSQNPSLITNPLCLDCIAKLHQNLEEQSKKYEEETSMFKQKLSEIENEILKLNQKPESDQKTIDLEEENLNKKIEDLRKMNNEYDSKIELLKKHMQEIDQEEQDISKKAFDFEQKLIESLEEDSRIKTLLANSEKEFAFLSSTNVLNDAFKITTIQEYGVINGFRLGRLPNEDVQWSEINSALGEVIFLLAVLASKFMYFFKKYELKPEGSTSSIIMKGENPTKYKLYYDTQKEEFNLGLRILLDCIDELGKYATSVFGKEKTNLLAKYQLKFTSINEDKISEASILYDPSKLDSWTRALKYLLGNLKWLIYVSQCRDLRELESIYKNN